MHVSSSTTSVGIPSPLASNLGEIGRFIEDNTDGEIDAPRTAAIRMFVADFIEQHPDAFEQKDDDLYVYKSDDE